MAMQPNRGNSGGSAAAKRLAEERANRNMGRRDMRGATGFGQTDVNLFYQSISPSANKEYGRLSGFLKSKQNRQVTSRQTIGDGTTPYRRDIPMETAPLQDTGLFGMGPKFKGYVTSGGPGGIDLVPEPQKRKRRIGGY